MPAFRSLLLASAILLASCAASDESRIEATVDDLVDALNAADRAAAGTLFVDGALDPLNAVGDSSVVYRLVTIPGGNGFEAENVKATVMADRAQAEFDLSGSVQRSDEVVGRMTMRVGLDLQKVGDEQWRIIPGSDRMLSTY
jgi:hypothetical protein